MFERLNTPEEIFSFKLGAALTMEQKLVDVLEELEQAAQRSDLKHALREHREQTRQHVANVERCFQLLGEEIDDSPCPAIEGLAKEGNATLKKTDDAVVDAVIVAAASESEYHEIAVYETLITYAKARGATEVTELLQANLEQEKHALELAQNTMDKIATDGVAAQAPPRTVAKSAAQRKELQTNAVSDTQHNGAHERPLALITGASSGIGKELATQFLEHGFDIVIAAEDPGIDQVANELRSLDGATVQAIQVDLSTQSGVEDLYGHLDADGRPLQAAALNAGIGAGGAFVNETQLSDELQIVDLNVRSTVHLAKRLLPAMVARGQGQVLFTSSIASTMPGSFQAVYNASKSFVQSFALALRNELKDSGVTITALMPGPTDTEFFDRANMLDTKVGAGAKDDPADVAREGFEALMSGDERIVSGSLKSKLQGKGSRLLPDSAKAEMHRKMAEPGSDKR